MTDHEQSVREALAGIIARRNRVEVSEWLNFNGTLDDLAAAVVRVEVAVFRACERAEGFGGSVGSSDWDRGPIFAAALAAIKEE